MNSWKANRSHGVSITPPHSTTDPMIISACYPDGSEINIIEVKPQLVIDSNGTIVQRGITRLDVSITSNIISTLLHDEDDSKFNVLPNLTVSLPIIKQLMETETVILRDEKGDVFRPFEGLYQMDKAKLLAMISSDLDGFNETITTVCYEFFPVSPQLMVSVLTVLMLTCWKCRAAGFDVEYMEQLVKDAVGVMPKDKDADKQAENDSMGAAETPADASPRMPQFSAGRC